MISLPGAVSVVTGSTAGWFTHCQILYKGGGGGARSFIVVEGKKARGVSDSV
jgi:hypothetical protein